MLTNLGFLHPLLFGVVVTLAATSLSAQPKKHDSALSWTSVEDALGRKGAMQPGDVMKFSFPRSDLSVSVAGVVLKPAFALGTWVAFKETGKGQVMAMGDLVLLDEEVNGVMRALQAGGVEQSALHNHLLSQTPHVMYLHISAHGDATKIARTIHRALGLSKTPIGPVSPPASPSAADLDTAGIANALGVAGKLNGVVYQVTVSRSEKIREMGHEVPPSMGLATAINFQPTGGGKAAITGDFVMRGNEVNQVIRALKQAGIDVAALHSHLIDEEPRLYFVHFWANDDAVTLAKGLRAALDKTKSKKG